MLLTAKANSYVNVLLFVLHSVIGDCGQSLPVLYVNYVILCNGIYVCVYGKCCKIEK
jgi:hypothetical protein